MPPPPPAPRKDTIRKATDEEMKRLWDKTPDLPSQRWDIYNQETRGDAEVDPITEGIYDALLGFVPFGKLFSRGAHEAVSKVHKAGVDKVRNIRKVEATANKAAKAEARVPATSELKKMTKVERFPAQKHDPEDLKKWYEWAAYDKTTNGSESVLTTPRNMTPVQKPQDKMRGVLKAASRTKYRRNPETGEMELMLHRGMGSSEIQDRLAKQGKFIVDESMASMTPKREIADMFASGYSKPEMYGRGVAIAAWVPSSKIRAVPRQTGYRARDLDSVSVKKKIGNIPETNKEFEIIVEPGEYDLAKYYGPNQADMSLGDTLRGIKEESDKVFSKYHPLYVNPEAKDKFDLVFPEFKKFSDFAVNEMKSKNGMRKIVENYRKQGRSQVAAMAETASYEYRDFVNSLKDITSISGLSIDEMKNNKDLVRQLSSAIKDLRMRGDVEIGSAYWSQIFMYPDQIDWLVKSLIKDNVGQDYVTPKYKKEAILKFGETLKKLVDSHKPK